MVRARYGTGVFLKLNKRNCDMRIRLTPIGADFMRVHFRIGGDNHYFFPSCVMGDQFSSFLTAVYCLYNEGYDYHQLHMRQWKRRFGVEFQLPNEENGNRYFKSIPILWDEEGSIIDITLSRTSAEKDYFAIVPDGVPDPISIAFSYHRGDFQYEVDGRDLCYAIARGYTEAIKKYGFQGYLRSTGMQYIAFITKAMTITSCICVSGKEDLVWNFRFLVRKTETGILNQFRFRGTRKGAS